MVFSFFSKEGTPLFRRTDAIEFEHYCEDMAFQGTFPLEGHSLSAGMLIGWQDDDDLWEVHEISSCAPSIAEGSVEISGSHLAIVELGTVVLPKLSIKNKSLKSALTTILSNVSNWWGMGTLPAAAEDDDLRKQRYRVTKSVKMYAAQSTKKRISTYKKGKYLTPVQKASDTWWQMEGADGRVGWIKNPASFLVRDGNAGDEDKTFTCDEKFLTVWDALTKLQDATGYIMVPRVTVSDSGITGRYLDARTGTPDYHGVRLTCTSNILDGALTVNYENTYTALVGVGKNDKDFHSVVWTTASGFPVDKPSGQYWVGLPSALTAYGHNGHHRTGVVHFDDETDASELLHKTYDYLVATAAPEITFDGTVADLYQLGYGGQSMRLYDKVQAILEPIGQRVELRITGLTRDLVRPEETRPVLGSLRQPDLLASLASAVSSATSIQSWQVNTGAIGSSALDDGAVIAGKIATDAIVATNIATGAIIARTIAAEAVETEKLAAKAVTASRIDANAVTAEKILAGAVTAEKIGARAVDTDALASRSVTTDKLSAGAVTAEKIAAGSITADRMTAGTITAESGILAAGVVGTAQIADGAITRGKVVSLNANVIDAGTLSVDRLLLTGENGLIYEINAKSAGLTATELSKEQYREKLNGTVIVAKSLTAAQIAAESITGNEILAGSIQAKNLDVAEICADTAFIRAINTMDIHSNSSLTLAVSQAVDGVRIGARNYLKGSRSLEGNTYSLQTTLASGVRKVDTVLRVVFGVTAAQTGSALAIS